MPSKITMDMVVSDEVDGIKLADFRPVVSTNLKAVYYRDLGKSKPGDLYVQFHHGGTYRYKAVPLYKYNAMLEAESVAMYFNTNIKNAHPTKKVQ